MSRHHRLTNGNDRTIKPGDVIDVTEPGRWRAHFPDGVGKRCVLISVDATGDSAHNDAAEQSAPRAKSRSMAANGL